MKKIVIISISHWDIDIGSNIKDMAYEISKNNKVLYINTPITRKEKMFNLLGYKAGSTIDQLPGELKNVNENLFIYTPECIIESIHGLQNTSLFDFLNKINNRRFSKQIIKAIGLSIKGFDILINDSHMFLGSHLKGLLPKHLHTYYIRDNLTQSTFWKKKGQKYEPKIISDSDIVFTNSIFYENYAKQFNKNSFFVGQGFDISIFRKNELSSGSIKKRINKILGPKIGYLGFITTQRLDETLIFKIAKHNDNWSVLLVGPTDRDFENSDLHKLSNVHFLGAVPPIDAPEYIKNFDVCINPQIHNIITIGNYPRKIDEYLALGKPVVATETEAMKYFSDNVYLSKTDTDFINNISRALSEDSKELQIKRRNTAESHSWEKVIHLMMERIDQHETTE